MQHASRKNVEKIKLGIINGKHGKYRKNNLEKINERQPPYHGTNPYVGPCCWEHAYYSFPGSQGRVRTHKSASWTDSRDPQHHSVLS